MDEDLASHGCRHGGFGWGGDVGVPGARADASLGEKKSVWYLDMLGKYGTITKIPWFSSIFVGELNEKWSGHMMLAIFEGESYI